MKNKRLFSKALFKQSCKANGVMWGIITTAVCFMLACVMLISGTSSITGIKEGIQDTLIEKTIESEIKKSSITLYDSTSDAAKIFDEAFTRKIGELNTYENYMRIKNLTDSATNKATSLVSNYVTNLVTNDVSTILQDEVSNKVKEYVTEEVTNRLTNQITNKVTELVTEEVTNRLTKEIETTTLSSALKDTYQEEALIAINTKLNEGKTIEEAIAEVTSTYQQQYTNEALTNGLTDQNQIQMYVVNKLLTNIYTPEASNTIQTKLSTSNDLTTSISETFNEYINIESTNAQNQILTDEHKLYISNNVLNEKKDEYTLIASQLILTEENQNKVTNEVLQSMQETFIAQATNDVVTDNHKQEVVNEVLSNKQEEYTNIATKALEKNINNISNNTKEKITDIITNEYIKVAYEYAINAVKEKYPEDKEEAKFGAAMVCINPDNQASDQYTKNNEAIPEEYINDLVTYLSEDITNGNGVNSLFEYINSDERITYRNKRAYETISMLIAANLTDEEYKQDIINELSLYNVNEDKYNSFGFDYNRCKTIAYEAACAYQNNLDYEISKINTTDSSTYNKKVQEIRDKLYSEQAGSFLDTLPKDVMDGLQELGTMDLYGLIVGSIFFKMAGLLLPVIYTIMCSNNLIASQVDTGSMAYVLSTSTRRKEVTYTQGLYLVGSLFLMFVCTAITSCVCFSMVDVTTDLTYSTLILLNIGAFITMLAIAGINFFTSCIFDRSKRAMALGGGVSIFFLVATMLGLFGSPVIPTVVRIQPLNNFNYFSLISLFDCISMLDGTTTWIYKLCILAVVGIAGLVGGSIIFKKRDLPL